MRHTRISGSQDYVNDYYFYASQNGNFAKSIMADECGECDFISSRRFPVVWRADIEEYVKMRKIEFAAVGVESDRYKIGKIGYYVDCQLKGRQVARTEIYFPRSSLDVGLAHNISYFLEALSTRNLQAGGTTHISTSSNPSALRLRQLLRVSLPVFEDTEIKEWLRGMGRGMRQCVHSKQTMIR